MNRGRRFKVDRKVGLAVLASAASARTHHLAATGSGPLAALTGGYHLAFVIGAVFAICAAGIGARFLRAGVAVAGAHAEPALETVC